MFIEQLLLSCAQINQPPYFICNSPELSPYSPDFSKLEKKKRRRGVGIDIMGKNVFDIHKIPIVTNSGLQKLHAQCPFSSYCIIVLLWGFFPPNTAVMIGAILVQTVSGGCFHCEQSQ